MREPLARVRSKRVPVIGCEEEPTGALTAKGGELMNRAAEEQGRFDDMSSLLTCQGK